MQGFQGQMNKLSNLELRPIKIELGGLAMTNTFSRFSGLQEYSQDNDDDDDDDNDDLDVSDQRNEDQRLRADNENRFEPEPEDDNFMPTRRSSKRTSALPVKKSIFSEVDSEDSANNINGQEQHMLTQVIEDSRVTRFLFQKIQLLETAQLIFSLITIILSIIQYDIKMKHIDIADTLNYFLLITISICTFVLIAIVAYEYALDLTFKKAQKILGKYETVWTSGSAYLFLLEFLVIIPHPNVLIIDKQITYTETVEDIQVPQDVNDYFSIWILVRTYLIFRCVLSSTIYGSTRAMRICRMLGCDSGTFYSIKCIFQEKPLLAVPTIFLVSVLLFGHALRIAEMPLFPLIEGNTQDFGNYINCFWCVIITMATVGYGDYYPKTLPGRIVIVLASIVGVVLVSILVFALNVNLNMSTAEKKTNIVIKRLKARKSLKESAANVLTKAAKLKILVEKGGITPATQKQKLNSVRKDIQQFRIKNRKIKNMYDNSSQSEEMSRQFDFLKRELKEIYGNQNQLRDYLLKIKTNLNQNDFEEPNLTSIFPDIGQE